MADEKAGAQRRKATPRGRTAAAVDKDVKALAKRFDGLEQSVQDGFANIADLLSANRAQELNDRVQASVEYDDEPARQVGEVRLPVQDFEEDFDEYDVEPDEESPWDDYDDDPEPAVDPRDFAQRGYAKPRKRKKSGRVGERPGDRVIRNLHNHPLRLRLGKPSDPYRVNLEARGEAGDVDQIPASLVGDLGYKRNLNRSFEEITLDEYDVLQDIYSQQSTGGYQGGYTDAELVMDEDRTIYDSARGGQQYDVNDPRTWPGFRGGGVGPRFNDAVGSDRQITQAARYAHGQEDDMTAEEADEYNLIRRRAQGLLPPDPNDPNGAAAMAKLKRRANAKRTQRLAGNDRESRAMAARVQSLERGGRAGLSKVGIIPEGELDKPVSLVRDQTISVTGRGQQQPYQGPSRRIPTENVPPVPRRNR